MLEPCFGCGALVPRLDGPTHRYLGASPGCWATYGKLLEKEYSDFRYARVHQFSVDAYCTQHPGTPSPQTIQSVAVHLISLHLQLECGLSPEDMIAARQQATSLGKEGKKDFAWLEPPASLGEVTVIYARDAKNSTEYVERVREWAESSWEAWSPYHETVRRWAAS